MFERRDCMVERIGFVYLLGRECWVDGLVSEVEYLDCLARRRVGLPWFCGVNGFGP